MKQRIIDLITNVMHSITKTNTSLLVLVAFAIKTLIISPSIADAMVLAIVCATYGYSRYIKLREPIPYSKQKEEMEKLVKDVKELKGALTKGTLSGATSGKKYF
jgi:hypothetical protein